MTNITYEIDGKLIAVEVTEEFAKAYSEMEKQDSLIERKETRRHQSLDKSLDNGFDIEDDKPTPEEFLVLCNESKELKNALSQLSTMQREVFLYFVLDGYSFTKIGNIYGISQQAASIHFYRAQKKLKKFLKSGCEMALPVAIK